MGRDKRAVLEMDAAVHALAASPGPDEARRVAAAWGRLARLMWPAALGDDADDGPDLVVEVDDGTRPGGDAD